MIKINIIWNPRQMMLILHIYIMVLHTHTHTPPGRREFIRNGRTWWALGAQRE